MNDLVFEKTLSNAYIYIYNNKYDDIENASAVINWYIVFDYSSKDGLYIHPKIKSIDLKYTGTIWPGEGDILSSDEDGKPEYVTFDEKLHIENGVDEWKIIIDNIFSDSNNHINIIDMNVEFDNKTVNIKL